MTPSEYATTINRTPRCVQKWCARGLIGKRIGARFEIDPTETPPVIVPTRKVGRVKTGNRLKHFKRKVTA